MAEIDPTTRLRGSLVTAALVTPLLVLVAWEPVGWRWTVAFLLVVVLMGNLWGALTAWRKLRAAR
jgi:hypothetical protein